MAGFARRLAAAMTAFWTTGMRVNGVSMLKSPRATITPSVSARISSRCSSAARADCWLWNTFVLVAKASVLAQAARRACPWLDAHWRSIVHQAVVEGRPALLDDGYASAPTVDFSRSVLEVLPSGLTVAPLLEWPRDGHPDLVMRPRNSRFASSWLLRPGYAM